jgi:hypothetical protein
MVYKMPFGALWTSRACYRVSFTFTFLICLSSDDLYSDSTLIATAVVAKQSTDIGTRSHVCGVFHNVCLNSRRWFML